MAQFVFFMAMVQTIQQADQAKKTGELYSANAELGREEDEEKTRRAKIEMKKKEATANARIAASGVVASSGSAQVYKNVLQKTHASEVSWMNRSTKSKYEAAQKGASLQRSAGEADAWSTFASGAGKFGESQGWGS